MALHYHRKIRCPRHFMLKTGKDPMTGMAYAPFKVIRNPQLKNLPEWAFRKWPTLLKWIPYKDKFGQKVREDKNFYQPEISAAFAVHQVYDPLNPICKFQCKGRCLEGLQIRTHKHNKRLQGACGA